MTQQLHFRSSCFFLVSRTVTFSQQLFFRAKILQSSQFLRIRSSLWQLLFRKAIFSQFRVKISKKRATFSNQVLLHSISLSEELYFGKNYFSEKHYCALPNFSGELLFREATFSKDGTFYSSYLLLFHSYASFPQMQFLSIC